MSGTAPQMTCWSEGCRRLGVARRPVRCATRLVTTRVVRVVASPDCALRRRIRVHRQDPRNVPARRGRHVGRAGERGDEACARRWSRRSRRTTSPSAAVTSTRGGTSATSPRPSGSTRRRWCAEYDEQHAARPTAALRAAQRRRAGGRQGRSAAGRTGARRWSVALGRGRRRAWSGVHSAAASRASGGPSPARRPAAARRRPRADPAPAADRRPSPTRPGRRGAAVPRDGVTVAAAAVAGVELGARDGQRRQAALRGHRSPAGRIQDFGDKRGQSRLVIGNAGAVKLIGQRQGPRRSRRAEAQVVDPVARASARRPAAAG